MRRRADHDSRSQQGDGRSPTSRRLAVCAPVDAASGGRKPGEHPAPVWVAPTGGGLRLAVGARRRRRHRPGKVRSVGHRPGWVSAAGGRGRQWSGWDRDGVGGLATGAQLRRLASAAGDLRPHRHLDPGRGRALRPRPLQRSSTVGLEGDDERGRVARPAGSPAGRLPGQSTPRRVAHPLAGGVCL